MYVSGIRGPVSEAMRHAFGTKGTRQAWTRREKERETSHVRRPSLPSAFIVFSRFSSTQLVSTTSNLLIQTE
jgi:hypothetical protein